jgi:hypothetical protein
MGRYQVVGFGLKSITKPFKKAVKGIAKKVRRLGRDLKKGFGKISEKLGPVGMIALAFVMPAALSYIGTWWSSAGAALTGTTASGTAIAGATQAGTALSAGSSSTIMRGIGHAMQAVERGFTATSTFLSEGANAITSRIENVFKGIGNGNIADGASALQKASTDVANGTVKVSAEGLGETIAKESIKQVKATAAQVPQSITGTAPLTGTGSKAFEQAAAKASAEQINRSSIDSILRAPNISDAIQRAPEKLFPRPLPGTIAGPPASLAAPGGITSGTPLLSPSQLTAQAQTAQAQQLALQAPELQAAGREQARRAAGITPTRPLTLAEKITAGVKNNAGTFASTLLGGLAAVDTDEEGFASGIGIPDASIGQRLGIGGRGSAGGSLVGQVDPSLLASLQQSGRQIEQRG